MISQTINRILSKFSYHRQLREPMPDVSLWGLSVSEKNELLIGDVSCVDLAKRFDTPLLAVDIDSLRSKVLDVLSVMRSKFASSIVTYSYKTNCIPGILNEMHQMGVGAEVISNYEYWVAESLGVEGDQIIYNGVDKSTRSIAHAILRGSIINLDSFEELDIVLKQAREIGRKARLGIRLALNRSAQFGIPFELDLIQGIVQRILGASDHAELCSVHFNVTSNAKSSEYHIQCLKVALECMLLLHDKYNITLKYIDIGGGYGIETSKNMSGTEYGLYRLFGIQPRRAYLEPCKDFSSYIEDISTAVRSFCCNNKLPMPTVIIEPGRLLTSKSEVLLASIKSIKEYDGCLPFAITDAGRLSQAFPCDFEFHEAFLANAMSRRQYREDNVTGRVCTKSDWLFRKKALPELRAGDILAVMDAGAYFSSYAMNFAFPRACIVGISKGEVRVLRRRESFRHLVAMDDALLAEVPEELF